APTLVLHSALPRRTRSARFGDHARRPRAHRWRAEALARDALRNARRASRAGAQDRKSTRLNSSHLVISYAVFCLKKKKKTQQNPLVGGTGQVLEEDPDDAVTQSHQGLCSPDKALAYSSYLSQTSLYRLYHQLVVG